MKTSNFGNRSSTVWGKKGLRATKNPRRRVKCPHCGTVGPNVPHDTPYGKSCRPSGQRSEREIKKRLNREYGKMARKNPIRKQFIIELLHKNYGIWYIKPGVRGGKNTSMRREAASKFASEAEATREMKAALAAFPASVRKNFVWIRTAVA